MNDVELQKQAEQAIRDLAPMIDAVLKQFSDNMGFALFVFEFNRPGISNYISSAERSSMILAIKETLERLERDQDMPACVGPIQ